MVPESCSGLAIVIEVPVVDELEDVSTAIPAGCGSRGQQLNPIFDQGYKIIPPEPLLPILIGAGAIGRGFGTGKSGIAAIEATFLLTWSVFGWTGSPLLPPRCYPSFEPLSRSPMRLGIR